MHTIAVLDYRLLPDAQEQIQSLAGDIIVFPLQRCPAEERAARTGDADIALVTPWDKIDAAYLDACPQLRYIGLCGTSTANVDMDELARRGIAFSNIVSRNKDSVAEYFFMQLVSLVRGAGKYQWRPHEEHELAGKRIGIIGLGAVGQAIAHLALAYNMKVMYFSPHRKRDWEERGLSYLEVDTLAASSDVLVICSPTNVEVLSKAEFEALPAGSIFVQASAGSPFDKQSFIDWIAQDNNYAIFDMSAGDDNYQQYKDIPRVIFPRVVAGDTYESNARRGQRAVENLKRFLEKQSS